jgi:hypothetical protein
VGSALNQMTPDRRRSLKPCSRNDDCVCLHALATLERLTGCDTTARVFEEWAERCGRERYGDDPGVGAISGPLAAALLPLRSQRRWPVLGDTQPIAFSRSRSIDILADARGNRVERRALKVEAVRESAALADVYRYWRGLRRGTPSRFSDLDPTPLVRAGIIGLLHVVDVGSSNPGDFRYELLGYDVPLTIPTVPSEMPIAIYAETMLRDYNTVRLTGVPQLQRIRARLDGTAYHYTRLILPFLNGGRRVSHLAVAIAREPGDGMRLAPR